MRPGQKKLTTLKFSSPSKVGLFITFEGIEGSGKTSQCHRLAEHLRKEGYPVVVSREPGGTPLAEEIRNLFLNPASHVQSKESITPECEAMLILACRRQHVTQVLLPELKRGAIVLCDRFFDSTLAYQGYGRGVKLKQLQTLNMLATDGLVPDITFLIDLPVTQGLARRRQTSEQNRIDQETKAFHERVRKGFLTLARSRSRRIVKLDGRRSIESISQDIVLKIQPFLTRIQQVP